MALTFPLPEVPESRTDNGIGGQTASFLIIPGTSDYVTNGYVISGLQVRMPKGILGVSVDGSNATAGPYVPSIQMAVTLAANNIPNVANSFNFALYWTGAAFSGVLAQVPANTNLAGSIWIITVTGY